MRKNLLLRLCLICLVTLTYSCRTDHFPENETYNNSAKFQLTSKRISLSEAKHKEKLVTEITKVEAKFKAFSKTNLNGKVIDYGNGVFIDTDQVTYIENGPNFHTYTFHINKASALPTDPVENLVLIPATDGTYREMLISYNLTPQEKQLILNGEHVDTKGKTKVTILDGNTYNPLNAKSGQSCVWMEAVVGFTACSQNAHFNGEGSSSCDAPIKSQAIKEFFLKCTSISSGTETGGGWWAGEGGGTDNGGGGTQEPGNGTTEPCNGNGVATNPVDPNTNIGEGGCEGIPTVIEMPNLNETPCAKIKLQVKEEKYKAKVEYLKEKVYETKEYGFRAGDYNDADYVEVFPTNKSSQINFEILNNTFGYMHSHYESLIPMFSPGDINTFIKLLKNAQNNGIPLNMVFMTLVCSDGSIYQLRGDNIDIASLSVYPTSTIENLADKIYLRKEYDLGKRDQAPEYYQKQFLKFMRDVMPISGAKLYSIDGNGKAKEISLEGNNRKTSDCPTK